MRDYLVVGDWSADGHGKTETLEVEHNSDNLKADYQKGAATIGFDLTEKACKCYEESYIDPWIYKYLKEWIPNMADYASYDETEEDMEWAVQWMDGSRSFAEVWLKIAQIGNPKLCWIIREIRLTGINIGGYGLFA